VNLAFLVRTVSLDYLEPQDLRVHAVTWAKPVVDFLVCLARTEYLAARGDREVQVEMVLQAR